MAMSILMFLYIYMINLHLKYANLMLLIKIITHIMEIWHLILQYQ